MEKRIIAFCSRHSVFLDWILPKLDWLGMFVFYAIFAQGIFYLGFVFGLQFGQYDLIPRFFFHG